MPFTGPRAAALVALAALCGCSADKPSDPFNFTTSAGPSAPGGEGPGYALSAEEQGLDCKKLAGRMQVRLMQIRDYETRDKTTLASRGMHSAGKMVFGGTSAGLNTDQQFAKDKAMLEAYNGLLVSKDCKSFDIPQALASTGVPVPTVDTPSKIKAGAEKAANTEKAASAKTP